MWGRGAVNSPTRYLQRRFMTYRFRRRVTLKALGVIGKIQLRDCKVHKLQSNYQPQSVTVQSVCFQAIRSIINSNRIADCITYVPKVRLTTGCITYDPYPAPGTVNNHPAASRHANKSVVKSRPPWRSDRSYRARPDRWYC